MQKLKLFFLLQVLILFSIAWHVQAAGISPPTIFIPNVFKGISQTRSVTLFRDNGTTGDILVTGKASGEYAHYIENVGKAIIKDGENAARLDVVINPKNASVGDYEVPVHFMYGSVSEGSAAAANAVSIVQGVKLTVKFSVTGKEVLSYSFSNFKIDHAEIGSNLYISYDIKNTGNVEWRPDEIKLEIINTEDDNDKTTIVVPESQIKLIKPGQVEASIVELGHELVKGEYLANIYFYYKGKEIGELSSRPFNVYPPGTLAQSGELSSLKTNKEKYSLGEKIKLEAIFKNTGDVPVNGQLITEVSRDNSFLDLLKGEELTVDKSKEVTFTEILDLASEIGKYTLVSYVEYGNRKTGIRSAKIEVISSEVSDDGEVIDKQDISSYSTFIIIVAVVLILGGAIIFKLTRLNRY